MKTTFFFKLKITETKLKIWETTLEKLVESDSDNDNEISELRGNIKGYYEKKAEASRIRSKVNFTNLFILLTCYLINMRPNHSHPSEVNSFSKKITCSSKIDTISSIYLPSLVLTLLLTLFYDQNYVNLSNLKFHPLCHTKS
jgi:hypothetical protein